MLKDIIKRLSEIQNNSYILGCWLDIVQTYISAIDNDSINQLELMITIMKKQNDLIFDGIEDFWLSIYDLE